jgi:hypothetical protein
MTPFDLLFLLLFLTAAVSLILTGGFALSRQYSRARRILWRLLLGAATYLLIVIAVSLLTPRRALKLGDARCFDDYCVSVIAAHKTPQGNYVHYSVDLQLSSHALRVPQRERNLVLYLTDSHSRRYDPQVAPSDTPFDVLLQPQQSVVATRTFLLPADATNVAAAITHEGGFPIGWLIIGYETWFHKPPLIALP